MPDSLATLSKFPPKVRKSNPCGLFGTHLRKQRSPGPAVWGCDSTQHLPRDAWRGSSGRVWMATFASRASEQDLGGTPLFSREKELQEAWDPVQSEIRNKKLLSSRTFLLRQKPAPSPHLELPGPSCCKEATGTRAGPFPAPSTPGAPRDRWARICE